MDGSKVEPQPGESGSPSDGAATASGRVADLRAEVDEKLPGLKKKLEGAKEGITDFQETIQKVKAAELRILQMEQELEEWRRKERAIVETLEDFDLNWVKEIAEQKAAELRKQNEPDA